MDSGRIRIKTLPYACTFFLSILAAQDITIEGTVIDDISGVAVSGVNIFWPIVILALYQTQMAVLH